MPSTFYSDLSGPGTDAFPVTKSDATVIEARALYVGTTGDVVVTTAAGNDVTFRLFGFEC